MRKVPSSPEPSASVERHDVEERAPERMWQPLALSVHIAQVGVAHYEIRQDRKARTATDVLFSARPRLLDVLITHARECSCSRRRAGACGAVHELVRTCVAGKKAGVV